MIDHSGLRYLFDQPNLNARQARRLATISEFDFEIKYIKGKENRVVEKCRNGAVRRQGFDLQQSERSFKYFLEILTKNFNSLSFRFLETLIKKKNLDMKMNDFKTLGMRDCWLIFL